MPLSLDVTGSARDSLAVSMAALLLADCKVEISSENLATVLSTAGVKLPDYYTTLFAGYISKAGGVDKYLAGPSAGGSAPAAAAAPAAGGAAAPAKVEKPKEEEVDALDGGAMDMFGGGGGGGGDY